MGNNFSRLCGGAKSHEELSAYSYDAYAPPKGKTGCLSGGGISEPRRMRSTMQEASFAEMSSNLATLSQVLVYGWIFVVKYDKATVEKLSKLDQLTHELTSVKRSLASIRGINSSSKRTKPLDLV